MAEKKKMTIEESIARLEQIVAEMENDKLPLDKSLKLYEEGIKIVSKCSGELETVKRRIQILRRNSDGEIELADVNTDKGED